MNKDNLLSLITGILIVVAIIGLLVQIKDPKQAPPIRTLQVVAGADTVSVIGYFYFVSDSLPAQEHSDSLSVIVLPQPHSCSWENCSQTGTRVFKPSGKFDEGSDGYLWEKTHFDHPGWTNEQCEDYIFIPINT